MPIIFIEQSSALQVGEVVVLPELFYDEGLLIDLSKA